MVLIVADIMSYSGDRLVREASSDVDDVGARRGHHVPLDLAGADASRSPGWTAACGRSPTTTIRSRLPVTSDDELGHAASRFNQMVEGLAEKAYLRDTFGKYVSEAVAATILANRGNTGRSVDTTAEATLMFTDIEGFTGLSESIAPAAVAAMLNDYLRTIVPVIQRHGGIVNSFIGDGLFASFNLPRPLENHAAAAIAAAIDIQAGPRRRPVRRRRSPCPPASASTPAR